MKLKLDSSQTTCFGLGMYMAISLATHQLVYSSGYKVASGLTYWSFDSGLTRIDSLVQRILQQDFGYNHDYFTALSDKLESA